MKTALYYFSGTGNSLHVVRGLHERIPGSSLIPMVSLLHHEEIITEAEVVGFVFPIHALTIPIAVKRFLERLDLRAAKYVFAVATRGGTAFRGLGKLDRLLERKGRHLDACFLINTGMNDPRGADFRCPDEAELAQMAATVEARLESICQSVTQRRVSRESDTDYLIALPSGLGGFLIEKLVLSGMAIAEYVGGVNYHYADGNCTGCGICERVCLSGKIEMAEKQPQWQKDVLCYMCFACVNFCPRRAVQIQSIPGVRSHTTETGRYSHPFATVQDIAAQKAGPEAS